MALSPSQQIDARIKELGDWRGDVLAKVRKLIKQEVPDVVEEWKWRGVPVWYHNGKIITTGESYKDKIKLTFAKGTHLKDPEKLFNSSLDGNERRAMDIFEDFKIDEIAFRALVRAAVDSRRKIERQIDSWAMRRLSLHHSERQVDSFTLNLQLFGNLMYPLMHHRIAHDQKAPIL